MKIPSGESEMPIDVWSMVVNLKQMLIDENLWWWIWNAHRCLIYGGDKSETKGDALNKLKVGGCPKQGDGRGMP